MIETIKKVAHFEIHLFTGNAEKELASYGISGDNVIYHGFVPLEDLYGKLKDYDIMLLPHGFEGDRTDIEFKTIFPTRTIPLLLSNRPILAHSPKDTFLTNFLIKHKCAVIVDTQSEQAILEAIDGIINHPESHKQMILNALEAAKLFDINKVSAQLKKAIEF